MLIATPQKLPLIIGHRGASREAPENTLESFQRVWSGAAIPTVEEVLAAIPHGTWFFIELKSGVEIIAPLKRALQASGISPERIRLLSFSAPLITELTQRLPEWHACWLCDYRHSLLSNSWRPSKGDVIETLTRTGACGVATADRAVFDWELAEALKELGKEIHVWTVDRPSNARRLCNLGVDSIMTNRPGWLRQKLIAGESVS